MVDRSLVLLGLLSPLAALAAFEGMIAAGVFPLALFGPVYAIARWQLSTTSDARAVATRIAGAATLGTGLALIPTFFLLEDPVRLSTPVGIGIVLAGVGVGTLAGLAAAPAPRSLSREEQRRWTLIEGLDRPHARGLVGLFLVAFVGAGALGVLREAAWFGVAGMQTLPEALLGGQVLGGQLVLPRADASVVVAVPLSLAPVALGFLASPREAGPLALGGLGALALAPLAWWFGAPVVSASGGWVGADQALRPGLASYQALAPAGLGVLVGASIAYVGFRVQMPAWFSRSLWALVGALGVLLVWGVVEGVAVGVGVLVVGGVLVWRSERALLGLALGGGVLVGGLVGVLASSVQAYVVGGLVGVVGGAGVVAGVNARTLVAPRETLRHPALLFAVVGTLAVAGPLAWVASQAVVQQGGPFALPHAHALASGLDALVSGKGALLVAWGVLAGGFVEWGWGQAAFVGLGLLVGPGVAVLFLVGALARAAWERGLLDRAREGYVMRGEMGYKLVRMHTLIVAVLAGEGLALAVGVLAS